MEPEDTWNAQLLVDWLEDELFREIYNATNVFTRANTLLAKIETDDPEPVIPAGDERHYVVSGEAVLIVLGDAVDIGGGEDGHPDTGDHANLPLYLVIALIALALLALTRRRKSH